LTPCWDIEELKMRMSLSLLVLVTLLFPVSAVFAGDTIELRYGWDVDDVRHSSVGGFDFLDVAGTAYDGKSLGTLCDMRPVPAGSEVAGYRVVREDWVEVPGRYRPASETLDGFTEELPSGGGGLQMLTSTGLLGYEVLVSVVEPMRVADGRVEVLADMLVEVDLRPAADSGLMVKRRSPNGQACVERALTAVLGVVPRDRSWEVQEPRGLIRQKPSSDGSPVDCVIITPDSLAGEFEPLVRWHDRMGIKSTVRTMEWVHSTYAGGDDAERIRRFLRDAYTDWGTVYVLLGGDPLLVPVRVIDVPEMVASVGRSDMPTDVYYTNLDGNWNDDGDGTIGEFLGGNPDKVDGLPDIFVGRALVSSAAEARIFVDKTMNYARAEKPGEWQETAVMLAQVLWPETETDGAKYAEEILPHLPDDFTIHRLYQNYREYPGAVSENVANVLSYVGGGCNVVSHIGHGDELRLDLGTEFMQRFQIESLDNDSMFCFVFMMNCSAADPRVESVAKAFTKNPHGGAFAVMGNSSLSFPYTGENIQISFYDLVFADEALSIGAGSALCRLAYLGDRPQAWWMYLNYILVGDPVVSLWKGRARSLEVSDVGEMGLADSVYSVEVTDGGVGVSGAKVVMMGERGEYGVGVTGGDGIAEVGYRPLGLGNAEMVVSREGYLMYEDSVEVVGEGGRLYVSSVSVDDGDGWEGNGDGEAGWGERLGIGLGLRNGGAGTLGGVGCDIRAVAGCSLYVRIEMDSLVSDSLIYVGSGCRHPGGLSFGLGVSEDVFGRCLDMVGHEYGSWLWLDGEGWHVRFMGDGEAHSYRCSLSVAGELLGYRGYELEAGDSLREEGGWLVFSGGLGASDFGDGIDISVGSGWVVDVHEGHCDYGSVGGGEVLGWYDVEFLSSGVGDGLGVWFEATMSDGGGGSWRDWFLVEVKGGEVLGERLRLVGLGGDTTGVEYGIRNVGGGGLRGVEGRLRGLSGVEVCDSVVSYGDICGGCYSAGGMYRVRELGVPVRYEVEWRDYYGHRWSDTLEVRDVGGVSGLGYQLVLEDLELHWEPSLDGHLKGYDVYRGDSYGGPYELVEMVDGYSRCEERGLASEESYYYYVCARDSMGNVSAPSETLEAWTGAPYQPGWPAELRGAAFSSPVVGDASHKGSKEVFLGSKGLEVTGIDASGKTLPGFPYKGECEVWASPALADLDGDGTLECIIGEGIGSKGRICTRILAFNHDGTFVSPVHNPLLPPGSPGWPQEVVSLVRSTPAIGDLDGDGRPEIVVGTESDPGRLYVFRYDGSPYLDGTAIFAQTECRIWASPCLADLDGDGMLEVIVCDEGCGTGGGNLYIWRYDGSPYIAGSGGIVDSRGSSYWSSPAVGDVDNDGFLEIVAVDTWGRIFVWNHDGSPTTGSNPVILNTGLNTWSSPALADFDGDGTLEIVVGFGDDNGQLALVKYNGAPLGTNKIILQWERALGYSAPVVADIDGDQRLEIVTCSEDGFVMGLESDGSFAPGYPIKIEGQIYSNPAIDDIDGDGDMDLLVASYGSRLHCWDLKAPYSQAVAPWPMFKHDPWRTGLFGFEAPGDTLAPRFSIAVFQNPVLDRVLDFFFMAGEDLDGSPEVVLRSATVMDTLESEQVPNADRIYRAHHLAGGAAAETVYVTATDLYGNRGTDFRVITYSHMVGDETVVTSADGGFTASAPSAAGALLAVLPVDTDYLSRSGEPDIEVGRLAYNLCIIGECESELSVRFDACGEDEMICVFDGGWKPVDGQARDGDCLVAGNARPGIYALAAGTVGMADGMKVSQGAPNPFGETCTFFLNVPKPRRVRMCVYDVAGRIVDVIFDGRAEGRTEISWDGRNSAGRKVSSGTYFVRAESGPWAVARKVILVR
jgi:hypothetical protein